MQGNNKHSLNGKTVKILWANFNISYFHMTLAKSATHMECLLTLAGVKHS